MDLTVETLGPRRIPSPVKLSKVSGDFVANYVDDNERVLVDPRLSKVRSYGSAKAEPPSYEVAGPRELIYFDPSKVRCAIVTCGGLCPGINDVIRSAVMAFWYGYGIQKIHGILYGYRGFHPQSGHETVYLTPDFVANIHSRGGTILGSSRGLVEAAVIVDALERMNINVLFAVGGDGTQRGALAVCKEINQRGLKIAVVGIPKTIDNDVSHVDKTFGYETAFSIAGQAVNCAHVEAGGAYNGIGLVKLMGRDSGFIAASAAIATHDVNFVLVPEVPFHLQGENGFLRHLRERLHRRHHAVICVAEGAGQDLMASDAKPQVCDASGNVKHADIGIFLSEAIKSDLQSHGVEFTLKYIDPSYMIRSAPAIPSDAVYCSALGQNAVHAAMAGKTAMIVGHWNDAFTHVPIEAAIAERKKIDPESMFWLQVLESTGQPLSMLNS